mgnify:CR=1 FL=1
MVILYYRSSTVLFRKFGDIQNHYGKKREGHMVDTAVMEDLIRNE